MATFYKQSQSMGATLKDTNALQCRAIMQCECKDTYSFIMRNGAAFREVIESFCQNFDRLPTVAELLWCASEIMKHDLRTEK